MQKLRNLKETPKKQKNRNSGSIITKWSITLLANGVMNLGVEWPKPTEMKASLLAGLVTEKQHSLAELFHKRKSLDFVDNDCIHPYHRP